MELHHGEMQRSVAPRRNRSGFLNSTRLRLKLLKSLGFFGNDRSESVYERVTSPRDLESAYRLVHDIYVDTGYIDPHPNGLRLRHFECSPDTATFVARAPSRAIARAPSRAMVGVLTVIMDSPDFGLPSDSIYQKEIDQIRREGGVLCEFSNQVVLPPYRRRGPRAELMRCALAYAFSQGATDIVCAVTPSVAPFYESMAFQQVGEVRSYSKNIDDPVVLIRESQIQTRGQTSHLLEDEVYGALVRYMYSDNPYFLHASSWNDFNQQMAFEQPEFASLLGKCPEVLEDLSHREGLRKRLGAVFDLALASINTGKPVPQHQRGATSRGRSHGRVNVKREFYNRADVGVKRKPQTHHRMRLWGGALPRDSRLDRAPSSDANTIGQPQDRNATKS